MDTQDVEAQIRAELQDHKTLLVVAAMGIVILVAGLILAMATTDGGLTGFLTNAIGGGAGGAPEDGGSW